MKNSNQTNLELVQIMDKIEKMSNELPKVTGQGKDLDDGFLSSKRGSEQPAEVFMSPWMKNLLEKTGDLNSQHDRLMVDDPRTKGEQWLYDACVKLLDKYFPGKNEYDETLPLRDVAHYNTQCRQQLHENMRQIQPGQAEEREEAIKEYEKPTTNIGIREKLLKRDPLLTKAVELVMNEMPYVKATNEWREVNTPFMNKHSNVGYKWWKKDNSLVPKSTETYGEMTLRLAKKIPLNDLPKWNLSTMYGRNQRKGRLIIAVPRIINLHLNRLQAPEIAAYKEKNPLFVGYGDDNDLKEALKYILNICEKNGWKCRNSDQSRFDRHISKDMILLQNAMRIKRVNGRLGQEIAYMRAALATKTACIDGLTHKVRQLNGRIFSGEIDTNLMGGNISATISTWGNLYCDSDFQDIPYSARYWMLVMGDDCLSIYHADRDNDKYDNFMKEIGFDTNKDKDEYGPMFLQYRLFEDPVTKKLVMAYGISRVIEHVMFKEQSKGLGPAGWYIAFLMQAQKVIEYEPSLKTLVNLVYPFDNYQLFRDKSISEIVRMMEQEDSERLQQAKTDNQKAHVMKQKDIISDGDPTKGRFFEDMDKAKNNDGLLHELHEKVRSAIDPDWLPKAGVAELPT